MSNFVTITEVGPRDGLQNESSLVPTDAKVTFITDLEAAGAKRVEVASFVNPDLVPAMADAEAIYKSLTSAPDQLRIGLVPNERGLERALEAGCQAIALFSAASDGFSRANINMTIDESLAQFTDVAKKALSHGLLIRGYVSTIFECPYDGAVSSSKVLEVSQPMMQELLHEKL